MSDPVEDSHYKLLDIVFENTKNIQGLGLGDLFNISGVNHGLEIEKDLININVANIKNAIISGPVDGTTYLLEILNGHVDELCGAGFKLGGAGNKLFVLIKFFRDNDPRLEWFYNNCSSCIHDAALIGMRMHAYGLSREVATKQVMGFTTDPVGVLKNIALQEQTNKNPTQPTKSEGQTSSTKETSSSDCFIATAAFGSIDAVEVRQLREFRDKKLLNSRLGVFLVSWYYKISPSIAKWVKRGSFRRKLVRFMIRTISPIAK